MGEWLHPGWEPGALTRRRVLVLAAGLASAPIFSGCRPTEAPTAHTVASWRRDRGQQYLIAHRGAGDVVPEHTLEAYQAALTWGAQALEISVVRTSDGVLICQHDLTYDRTTNLQGRVATQSSSVLLDGRVNIGRLGSRWQGTGSPRIARLDDVLRRVGRQAVLCIEPKDDDAYAGMMRMIEEQDLSNSVIVKLPYTSPRIAESKSAGYPVFAYIGDADDATPDEIKKLASRLDPTQDVMVLPANGDKGPLPDETLQVAVATGVPIWVFPIHRRWEVKYFFSRGVSGLMASSIGYLSKTVQPVRATEWAAGALAPGEMTQFPDSDAGALEWREPGAITLAAQQRQAFVTLGQLAPLERASGPYRVDLEIRVEKMPSASSSNFTVAFGHADDRYYQHRQGTQDGYHAILRMDGGLELRSHRAGSEDGSELGKSVPGPAPVEGQWIPLRLDVGEKDMAWSRLDTGAIVRTENSEFRGDFMHIGRSAPDGRISVRRLVLT